MLTWVDFYVVIVKFFLVFVLNHLQSLFLHRKKLFSGDTSKEPKFSNKISEYADI